MTVTLHVAVAVSEAAMIGIDERHVLSSLSVGCDGLARGRRHTVPIGGHEAVFELVFEAVLLVIHVLRPDTGVAAHGGVLLLGLGLRFRFGGVLAVFFFLFLRLLCA
ncbi:hypothetical protein DESC_510015 [Desulfosarcina cetonica]|nr:hypothetical protein DESC_510015 [Desulfosarcina cetonica]